MTLNLNRIILKGKGGGVIEWSGELRGAGDDTPGGRLVKGGARGEEEGGEERRKDIRIGEER